MRAVAVDLPFLSSSSAVTASSPLIMRYMTADTLSYLTSPTSGTKYMTGLPLARACLTSSLFMAIFRSFGQRHPVGHLWIFPLWIGIKIPAVLVVIFCNFTCIHIPHVLFRSATDDYKDSITILDMRIILWQPVVDAYPRPHGQRVETVICYAVKRTNAVFCLSDNRAAVYYAVVFMSAAGAGKRSGFHF
nr:MAG TPA: hypothetical protein [Caudoviricetes sp.]